MRNLKYYLLVFVLLLGLICFQSCGDNDGPTENPDPPAGGSEDEPGNEDSGGDGSDIEIPRIDFGSIFFTNRGFPYDGEEHSIFIRGDLPEGVTVEYENNGKITAGSYEVIAKFYYKGIHIEGKDKKAKLNITKGRFDVSQLLLRSSSVGYDGKAHSLLLEGEIPDGLTVSYVGNNVSEEGTYTVRAVFDGDFQNYYAVDDMVATLVISSEIPAGVSFTETYLEFDGDKKSAFVEGTLPEGVTVEYYGNEERKPGDYDVMACFVGEGYGTAIAKLHVTLPKTIEIDEENNYGFEFEKIPGGYAVVGFDGERDYAVVPQKYKGAEVLSVGTEAFKGCNWLKYVYIPETVTNIGVSAFEGCTELKEISLCEGLQVIGQKAFAGIGVQSFHIPSTVLSIGFAAFEDTKPMSMTIPFVGGSVGSSNKFFGYIFGAIGYVGNSVSVPSELKTVYVLANGNDIPAYSFFGCDKIEHIIIEGEIESIGVSAFSGCKSLMSVYIPSSVKTIFASGFDYNSPFWNCNSKLVIYFEDSELPENCGKYAFLMNENEAYTPKLGVSYIDYLLSKMSQGDSE